MKKAYFMREYWFFLITFVMGEMMEEWKNSIVKPTYKKGDKEKVENYKGISLLNACYKPYNKILSEKLKARGRVPFGMPEWIPKRQICINALNSMKLLIQGKNKV
jgi:hypothetical protein